MKIFGIQLWGSREGNRPAMEQTPQPPAIIEQQPAEQIDNYSVESAPLAMEMSVGGWMPVSSFTIGYDGELGMGNMGAPKNYVVQFQTLRVRSRQMYLEHDLTRIAVRRRKTWTIGTGRKLQCEPQTDVLEMFGIKLDSETFNSRVEGWFKVYQDSTMPDWAGMKNLTQLMNEAMREMDVAGGMLVVLRVENYVVKIQHIDAARVVTPPYFALSEDTQQYGIGWDYKAPNGNRVRNGVELNARGQHVAYYVAVGTGFEYERIPAKGAKTGLTFAYMIYRELNGVDDVTGVPMSVSSMETASILQRYNSAVLTGEEERAKVPFFFEHGTNSKQIDPQLARLARATAGGVGNNNAAAGLPTTASAEQLADKVAASLERSVYNLPNDVTIKAIQSDQNSRFAEVTRHQGDKIAAAADMPPNVLSGSYDGSFSSSRMAGKDWEHTFMGLRVDIKTQYFMPIYTLQVYMLVLQNYVDAPGFVRAVQAKNQIVYSAYLQCRLVGDKFPDVDQLKTAKYLREMLGDQLGHAPLMTLEAAAEEAGQGDYRSIIKQIAKEKPKVEQAGMKHESKVVAPQTGKKDTEEEPESEEIED